MGSTKQHRWVVVLTTSCQVIKNEDAEIYVDLVPSMRHLDAPEWLNFDCICYDCKLSVEEVFGTFCSASYLPISDDWWS